MVFHSYFLYHYYINPPFPSFQSTQKLLSLVLVKYSSLVISWSSWDSRYWVRLTLPLLTHSSSPNSSFPPPLGLPSRVSSSTIWILHEGIIHFPNFFLYCHDKNLGLRHDSNYLNPLEYIWMFLIVLMCSSHVLRYSSHVHAYH